MRNHGLGSWTARRARKNPDATAVIHGEVRLSYADLHARCTRLARHLRALGVRAGDRVAFLGPNQPAFLETLFAAGMLGAVFVPLNTRLAVSEVLHCVADSGAVALVYDPGCDADVPRLAGTLSVRHTVPVDGEYEGLVGAGPAEPLDEPVSLEDPCLILYTSGTTGPAKGALLTHGNLTWNCFNVLVDTDWDRDEVTLVNAPLFHSAALGMTCLPTLLKGGTLVLEPSFDPARMLRLIERHGVTVMFGVPTMYSALADTPGFAEADLSSVRSMLCGGAPVPEPLIRAYLDRGLCFVQGYGMTEAGPGLLLLDAGHVLTKAGTAGLPHFFTDLRVAGPDGVPVPAGERGEVQAEGPNVMAGYWGLPEATARALEGGWLRSGDVATADEDGYVRIVDRVKDMIISGGENIYPAEVEEAFHRLPAVADCAVIGVPDQRWGEVGRAVVVLRDGFAPDEATGRDLLESLTPYLAKYKIPKSVVFTDGLPRSAAGKLLKAPIRERYGA